MTILILYAILEVVKRILSAVLYPVIYLFRARLRTDKVLWPEYLYEPITPLALLWLFLDDSIHMETGKDCANQTEKYPWLVNALGWTWLKCYWWSAIRNSCVNWNNFSAFLLGDMVSQEKSCVNCTGIARRCYYRGVVNDKIGDCQHYTKARNFYEIRTFKNGERPYCEFWTFGRRNQIGWIKRGRFEIDVMKRISK